MTGEITLRGRVLPIGGLKEKLLAALRGGIKTVIIPEENVKDLAEIPVEVQEQDRHRAGRAGGRRPEGRARQGAGADHLGRGGRSPGCQERGTDRPARGSPPTDTIWCRRNLRRLPVFPADTPRRKARGFCSRSVREASVFPRFFGQFRAISPLTRRFIGRFCPPLLRLQSPYLGPSGRLRPPKTPFRTQRTETR